MKVTVGSNKKIIFDKAPGDNVLSIALTGSEEESLPGRILNDITGNGIATCLFSNTLPKPFVVTSERTGISLFYKELDINKNAIIEHLTENSRVDPLAILESMRSRYARPIQDNIDIVRDYENISKRKSFLRNDKSVQKSLTSLLGGSFKSVGNQIFYQPRKERNRDKVAVPVYLASSATKSLFLIDLYSIH